MNDFVGQWLAAKPVWHDLHRYREHHLKHHRYTGTDRDPDLALVRPFPTTKASLRRKFFRDIIGATGVKGLIGNALMDWGYLSYTVAGDPKRLDQTGRNRTDVWHCALRYTGGMLLCNAILFAILFAVGKPWLYGLWVVAYVTTFPLFARIRSIAEHACTAQTDDQRLNTRHIDAGFLARVTVAPHHVNYHLAHHLFMAVPYYNLPALTKLLRDKGYVQGAHMARNYREVLVLAMRKG
jgi:fatty acid desaturase